MRPQLAIVLHAHAPLARPESNGAGAGELFALCEHGLLPLIEWLGGAEARGDGARVTLAVSPTLIAMLKQETTRSHLDAHLEERVALAQQEVTRAEGAGHAWFHRLAARQRDLALARLEYLRDVLHGDVVGALRRLGDERRLSLIPSTGAHAVLPLVPSERLQALHVAAACADFERDFGRRPDGVWLPECAWAPGLDTLLAAQGVRFTVAAAAGLRPVLGAPDDDALRPVRTPAGVVVFPEHAPLRAALVGPGGAAEDPSFARPLPRGVAGLLPYYARGDGEEQPPLDLEVADERACALGADLLSLLDRREAGGSTPPAVLALELAWLGAEWPEGLTVLRALVAAAQDAGLHVGPLVDAVDDTEPLAVAEPIAATWRPDGYYATWVTEESAWMFRRLARLMERVSGSRAGASRRTGPSARAVEQALRELLLAQGSDAFAAVSSGRDVASAVRRFEDHLRAAGELLDMAAVGRVDETYLERRRVRTPVFGELDSLSS